MTNRTALVALGTVLAALALIALLVFVEKPDGAPGPDSPAQPTAEPIVADGVETAETDGRRLGAESEIAREDISSNATTGSLLVKVLWPDRDPAPGIAISFRVWTRGLSGNVLEQGISDERGEVRADGLPPGNLLLRSERGGTQEIEVVAGRQQECEFILPEGIEVRGVVVDRRDRPVAGAAVWLQTEYPDWSAGRVIAQSGADGSFALTEIPAGLSLGAIAAGHAPSALVDLDTVDTSSPPVAVRLVLEDGAGAVGGRVVDPEGMPIAGALVVIGERPDRMEFRGRDRWIEFWSPRTAISDEEGRFEFEGIKTGTMPLAARAKGFGFGRREVQVVEGDRAWVDVTLAKSATVAGIVSDPEGEPIVDGIVHAYDLPPRTPFIMGGQIDFDETFGHIAAATDAQGHYELRRVTPGKVHLFAQEKRLRSVDGAVPWVTRVLEVEPGEDVEWNPVVGPGRTIEGIVLYQDGHPMERVFVSARDEETGLRHTQTNDVEGYFRFVCLEGATYSLHVQYWDAPRGIAPLEMAGVVPEQGSVELRAPYPKPVEGATGEVIGRVDDAGGRIPHAKAIEIHLTTERGWRPNIELADGAFRVEDVEPGRYRILVMVDQTAVAQTDWFEVGESETIDVGTLRTEPPQSLVIKLDRGPDALEVEPRVFLTRKGWTRGAQVEMERLSEARLDNLTAGTYEVSASGTGMKWIRDEVEVRAGELNELRLTIVPAALIRFEIWYPRDWSGGKATFKVIGSDGEILTDVERTHTVPQRPYERGVSVPRGEWTVEVDTESGWSASTRFTIDSLDREYSAVRVGQSGRL